MFVYSISFDGRSSPRPKSRALAASTATLKTVSWKRREEQERAMNYEFPMQSRTVTNYPTGKSEVPDGIS